MSSGKHPEVTPDAIAFFDFVESHTTPHGVPVGDQIAEGRYALKDIRQVVPVDEVVFDIFMPTPGEKGYGIGFKFKGSTVARIVFDQYFGYGTLESEYDPIDEETAVRSAQELEQLEAEGKLTLIPSE